MKRKEITELCLKASAFGLIMFFSAVFSLLLNKDIVHLKLFSDKLFLIAGMYIAGAVVLGFIFSSDRVRAFIHLFTGPAMLILLFTAFILLPLLNIFLEDYIRGIAAMHIIVILLMITGNYLYMRAVSAQLNNSCLKNGFKLIEDLPDKPKNEDEFMQYIFKYADKNNLELEIIKYGIPAVIRLDGELNEVSLKSYLSLAGGIIYTLEFKNI